MYTYPETCYTSVTNLWQNFFLDICFNLNFPKYTYGRSKYNIVIIINVNKNSFHDWVGLVKNNKIFYSHCKCPTLIVMSINEENISQTHYHFKSPQSNPEDCQLCAANDVEVDEYHWFHHGWSFALIKRRTAMAMSSRVQNLCPSNGAFNLGIKS